LFDKGHVAPGVGRELPGVVVALPREPDIVGGQVVPLLAGDLAGLAADADGRVGEEAVGPAGDDLDAGGQLRLVRDHVAELRLGTVERAGMDLHPMPPWRRSGPTGRSRCAAWRSAR